MAAPNLTDLTCVIHAHTIHSDGTGTVADVVRGAQRAGVDVMLLSDHNTLAGKVDEGWYEGTLLLVGEEISPKRRDHTLSFGTDEHIKIRGRPIGEVCRESPLAFAAHPFSRGSPRFRQFRGIPHSDPFADSIDGVEVWSWVTDVAERAESVGEIVRMVASPRRTLVAPPDMNLIEWDRACKRRRVVGIGGVDAHQVGVRVAGRVPLRAVSYARAFRTVRTHVLCDEPVSGSLERDRAAVYDAMRDGRCYVVNHAVAPARGFAYWGDGGLAMGAEAPAGDHVLHARLPRPASLRLLRDGEQVAAADGAALDYEAKRAGAYRVEARVGRRTWILSNPIYLR